MTSETLKKIRIVYLIGQLGLGGSERQLFLLLKHINRERFDCRVIVFNPSPNETYEKPLRDMGIQVTQVPEGCRSVLQRVCYLYRQFRDFKPRIVHSWTVYDNPYAGAVGWLSGVPVRIGSLRGSLIEPGMKKVPFYTRLLAVFSVSSMILNSEALVNEIRQLHFPESRIRVIPNCVEIAGERPDSLCRNRILSDLGLNTARRVIGTVGNLRRVKNQAMFVAVLARIISRHPDVRGLIVGHPVDSKTDYENELRHKIEDLGMAGKIILTGFRNDVPRLMHVFDIFCLTSDSEGMPNVVLEAMAAGCPVVATRVGGIPQLVAHGISGLLIPPADDVAFEDALQLLLQDSARAISMGEAGRRRVESEFSPQAVLPLFESYYRKRLK